MQQLLAHARAHQAAAASLIRRLVECESPSGDEAALRRMAELVADEVASIAKVRFFRGGHLRCDFQLPGRRKAGRILGLGHLDTVWPVGTLKTMPFRKRDGRLWGPGVFDMKSGIALFIMAMRALRDLERPVRRRVSLLLVTDEETGSRSSRPLTEKEALASDAVLVLEPAFGPEGRLKTARKGVAHYRIAVHGRAAHSGIDFEAGASAVVELSHQVVRASALTDLERGLTVNPGVIRGGSRVNVVAPYAEAEIDLRFRRAADGRRATRKIERLRPVDPRCRLEITGGVNRPPLERTRKVARLFALAQRLAAEIGVELGEAETGGASDGNFTAALGVPTLDGLGGVGEGAHAPHESVFIDRIADRTALLAGLAASL